ncbi:MAG: protein kinase domain-containing protein, partial [Kofleriaceae bacterium]
MAAGRACPQHGGAPAVGAPIALGAASAVPAWTRPLGREIGRGGFAAVWEVADAPLVLKVAHADHELARARMRREAEALAAIGAPAAPRLDGHGVLDDGRAWIAMERISGANLGELLAEGPLASHRAVAIAGAILDALSAVHAAGFAHRDLKPDNLVLRADGSIAVLDLGLARKLPVDPDDPTRPGVLVGSLEYLPPEQLLDAASIDARADLYAFGCVLYELCAGRPPFIGDAAVLERAHAALRPPPLGALASVPEALEALCHACLAKQPARRPASAAALRARLREVATAPSPGQRAQHSMSVIRSGKQPVVLLWAELPRVDRALLGKLAARKIVVVSQRGRRVLGGIVGGDHTDPAGAAIAAARDLAAAGARVALHLEALEVASGPSVALAGPAVEHPESWLPGAPWTGVVLTRALATVAQAPTRAAPGELGAAFVELGEPGGALGTLFGRDAVLSDLVADAATALAGRGPALALLLGEPGIGKSAVAGALVPRLRELRRDVQVVLGAVPPPGSGRPGHSALDALIGAPEGPIVRAVGDALRAAARRRPTAIVLDDLHLAEHELLDALEYATLGGEPLALWILGVASPRLDQRRPGFGARAERVRRDVLPPLAEDDAVALTAALLRPADYPPLRALRQIAAIAHGNPMHLTTLAREIHDRGAIRTRPNGEHFLDTSALDALPPIALGPWLAARELAELGVELVALARVCAVLGGDISAGELAAVVAAVERAGGATTTIDVEVGLAELASAGILVHTGDHWAFRQGLLEEGVYATTHEDERRAVHLAALAHARARTGEPASAERIARHAEAVGERRLAAEAFARIGARAHAEHRALDADQAWQGALRNLDARDEARGRALLGRARARYRQQRIRDALADLDEACAIARELADTALEIEALLERSTALDWGDDFEGSAAAAREARARLLDDPAPALDVEVELAEARSLWRAQQYAAATPRLRAVQRVAHHAGRRDTEILATLMLAMSLTDTQQLDAAEPEFAHLLAMCEAAGDRFHLGAGYANRSWLWSSRGEMARADADLQRVIQIAREIGQATLERIATYNRAESLLWAGALDAALPLARRSLSIQRGHGEGAAQWDLLLVARIL